MNFMDRTNHTELAKQHAARVADRYIPAVDRNVAPSDNVPASVAIEAAKDTMADLGAFLKETPVIMDMAECRAGDAWIERSRINLQSLEDERKPKVDALNKTLRSINEPYRLVREPLAKMLDEIKRRVSVFKNKVEAERQAEADRLRKAAEEQERLAAEAAAKADDAIACADVGECTDVGAAIYEADVSARDAGRADRAASRAEREVTVRNASIAGGKALSMRTVAVVNIVDPAAAIKALGLTENVRDALRKDALAYEKEFGELPPGITRTYERRM